MTGSAHGGAESEIKNGIEWFATRRADGYEELDCQCARCGSGATWADCESCGGGGYAGHDCGEDSCCCLHPEDNVKCDFCRGHGGRYHCGSSLDWCQAHPLPGREQIESTALAPETSHAR